MQIDITLPGENISGRILATGKPDITWYLYNAVLIKRGLEIAAILVQCGSRIVTILVKCEFDVMRFRNENSVSANSWTSSLLESLDEQNDALIFQSVVESMRQWTLHKKFHHRRKRDVSKVCYEDVGCFEDTGPFSYLEMLPSPPKDVGTRFLVYGSRKARSIPMEVPADDINDNANRAIDPDLPTKVIVHGFGSSCEHIWVYEMRSALMSVHECNIVCVDWGPGSAVPNYVRAAANTRLVGRQLAKLIRSLNVPLEKIHMIGFSLGAHVAGFAGAELGNVSRITGLDPAGPLFESQDPRARLDETDANFVDVIHSNGEQLILGGLGSWQPMGDVDFYPNGGRMQTGCSNIFLGAVSDIIWSSAVEGRSLCNHRRAYKFFTDSVSPKCRFPAFPCEQGYDGLLRGDCFPCGTNGMDKACGDMGYYSEESPARGQLYLVTRDEEPFCAHQYQVKVYNSRSERPTRSYGKLQVTLVGEGSFNDTFAMTKKDEELLVGAVLQKIVVPHPAVLNLEAIEIKYTAYSGWISSGLVTWNIDKVAIADSFGKILSICKKGLVLESGRSVYLPLFSGECHVPVESENSTSPESSKLDRLMQEKPGGIGPFTKEQNYEIKDEHSTETFAKDRTTSSKGLGPFTKDENLRLMNRKEGYSSANSFEESTNNRGTNNPWTILDISGDGDTNSLENLDSESGRGFSGSNFVPRSSASESSAETTTENLPEIREPVLRASKKDAGRSLKLSEITEPILKPRSTRHNIKNEVIYQDNRKDEIQETSSTSSRGFTVQFLPERLAGILAQAERYARQTLLPLISQYTPSFVSSARNEPKYFPPLGDIVSEETIDYSKEFAETGEPDIASETPEGSSEVIGISEASKESVSSEEARSNDKSSSKDVSNNANNPVIIEAVYPEKETSNSTVIENHHHPKMEMAIQSENNDWIPISELSTTFENLPSRRDLNVSRSLDLESGKYDWSTQSASINSNLENMSVHSGSMGWMPITDKQDNPVSLNTENTSGEMNTAVAPENEDLESKEEETSTVKNDGRRFIPLIDLKDGEPSSTNSNDSLESQTSTVSYSHIQKIPRPNRTRIGNTDRSSIGRSMVFPYAYERNEDPRTRYIPLIPEEDLGRSRLSFERER